MLLRWRRATRPPAGCLLGISLLTRPQHVSLLLLPVFSFIRYSTAGLILALAGCRSSALPPKFAATTGYRSPRPVQRFDTTKSLLAPTLPSAPQKWVQPEVQPATTNTSVYPPPKKREQPTRLGSFQPKPTIKDTVGGTTQPLVSRRPREYASPKFFSVQTLVHYGLHFLFPAVLALIFFPAVWQTAYLIMLATMIMDLDHLLAKPIFDPLRCSIGYHPLHSFYAIPVYTLLLLLPVTQIAAVGLLFHLFTDMVDCLWNFSHCRACYLNSRIYALRSWVKRLLARERGK
ncbi:DUF6122 family protein [Hymenobacter fodinae]|jgi:hypothetical protein|uniref:DUF6122 family protein n=1 Tax=Hymenobacter fodinae TaxID=2510796 RepID=UPI0021D2785A|nr:DUF6122 family protein [Hymenobacter fodinae]